HHGPGRDGATAAAAARHRARRAGPRALAAFYRRLFGWPVVQDDPTWATLRPPGGGPGLSFQLEERYERPTWPAPERRQQMQLHLDIAVEDLVQAGAHAAAARAEPAELQPPHHVRVPLDPGAHPFFHSLH